MFFLCVFIDYIRVIAFWFVNTWHAYSLLLIHGSGKFSIYISSLLLVVVVVVAGAEVVCIGTGGTNPHNGDPHNGDDDRIAESAVVDNGVVVDMGVVLVGTISFLRSEPKTISSSNGCCWVALSSSSSSRSSNGTLR